MSTTRARPALAIAGAALTLALAATAPAADAPSDLQRTRAARAALAADPELARLNLGVTVTGDAVRVWGQADAAKARRALECVRKAAGGEVLDETHAPPAPIVREFAPKSRPVTLPAGEEPPAAAPDPAASTPAPEVVTGPLPGPSVLPATVADVSRFRGPRAAVPTAGGAPAPALAAAVPEGETLAVMAERARLTDRRWAGLAVTADDGVLKLGGTTAGWSAVWDLADVLRALPGVRAVEVTGVRVGR